MIFTAAAVLRLVDQRAISLDTRLSAVLPELTGAEKITIRDHVRFQPDRMAKIELGATERALLDLYCVAPGQTQKPHSHGDQDKIYVVLEGEGRVSVGGAEETLGPGEAMLAPAGVEHGLVNDGPAPLLVSGKAEINHEMMRVAA